VSGPTAGTALPEAIAKLLDNASREVRSVLAELPDNPADAEG